MAPMHEQSIDISSIKYDIKTHWLFLLSSFLPTVVSSLNVPVACGVESICQVITTVCKTRLNTVYFVGVLVV